VARAFPLLLLIACSGSHGSMTDAAAPPPDAPVAPTIDAGPPPPDAALPGTVWFVQEELLPPPPGLATTATANIRRTDFDGDGVEDLLVNQANVGIITVVPLCAGCTPVDLAIGTQPVRGQAVDLDGNGTRELLVTDIGSLGPTTDLLGRVLLVEHPGAVDQTITTLLEGVGRTACAEAADLDGDTDLDVVVCVFGHTAGELLWLEQRGAGFVQHTIEINPGAIHAFPFDADADGDLDIAAVFAQDVEEVVLYRNDGSGGLSKESLFTAESGHYGSAGIDLVDLDGDGDQDLLYVNGDMYDGWMAPDPASYYGVAWLENDGQGAFTYHDLFRIVGAYSVTPADLDLDGDLDLAVVTFQPLPPVDPAGNPVEPSSLVWLENDGAQNFVRHDIAGAEGPPWFMTVETADIDADGDADIVAGPMLWDYAPAALLYRNQLR
jgi:hypothetical protein